MKNFFCTQPQLKTLTQCNLRPPRKLTKCNGDGLEFNTITWLPLKIGSYVTLKHNEITKLVTKKRWRGLFTSYALDRLRLPLNVIMWWILSLTSTKTHSTSTFLGYLLKAFRRVYGFAQH